MPSAASFDHFLHRAVLLSQSRKCPLLTTNGIIAQCVVTSGTAVLRKKSPEHVAYALATRWMDKCTTADGRPNTSAYLTSTLRAALKTYGSGLLRKRPRDDDDDGLVGKTDALALPVMCQSVCGSENALVCACRFELTRIADQDIVSPVLRRVLAGTPKRPEEDAVLRVLRQLSDGSAREVSNDDDDVLLCAVDALRAAAEAELAARLLTVFRSAQRHLLQGSRTARPDQERPQVSVPIRSEKDAVSQVMDVAAGSMLDCVLAVHQAALGYVVQDGHWTSTKRCPLSPTLASVCWRSTSACVETVAGVVDHERGLYYECSLGL